MKKILFSTIFIGFLLFGVSAGWFRVSHNQSAFSNSNLIAALSSELIKSLREQIVLILLKIKGLQGQLDELVQQEKSGLSATTATSSPVSQIEAVITPLSKFIVQDLNFKVDFPILQMKNYTDFLLLDFVVESKEAIAITRLRFKQTGTLADHLMDNIRLVDASSGIEVLLAKFGNPVDGFIELAMIPDENKINKGLVVPGRRYKVFSTIIVRYGALKPTISLSIENSSDVSAFDFNNLDRVADIPASIFPIGGPTLVVSI